MFIRGRKCLVNSLQCGMLPETPAARAAPAPARRLARPDGRARPSSGELTHSIYPARASCKPAPMGGYIELPIWLVVLALLLAAIGALDRVLAPSMRWFLRKRMEKAVARLNTRLQRPIEPFKLMARQDRINRLIYDPKVTEAGAEHAHETGVPEPVAAQEAKRYAREIVPGFSTLIYFGVAARVTRWLSRALYRVRIGRLDTAAIAAIDPNDTVIFVMNHRSNMDYILVT